MARRSDRANFYYFPTDCPHREKNGWTGDAQVSAEHMILTIGAEKSWREWLNNIRAAQDPKGELPGIVPTGTWAVSYTHLPLIYVVSASFSNPADVAAGRVVLFPVNPTMVGYDAVLKNVKIVKGFLNSVFYLIAGTSLQVCLLYTSAMRIS